MKDISYHGMKLVHVNVDQMQVFKTITSTGIMINADVNAKKQLIKLNMLMHLCGILVHANANVID